MLPTRSIPSAVERVILKKESVSELVKSGSYAEYCAAQFVLICLIDLGLTDATLTCPDYYLSEVIIEGKV